jgi:hypothetical protein
MRSFARASPYYSEMIPLIDGVVSGLFLRSEGTAVFAGYVSFHQLRTCHATGYSRSVPQPDVSRCSNVRMLRPTYSMTSSARASSIGGTVRPRALAVLRLMISSTLVDCWTGRSAGFSPLRIRPL